MEGAGAADVLVEQGVEGAEEVEGSDAEEELRLPE